MSKDDNAEKKVGNPSRRSFFITLLGVVIVIILIILTVDVSHRNINAFITAQEKYILSVEGLILVAFIVELLVRLTALGTTQQRLIRHRAGLRLIIRIVGYTLGSLSIISILAANPTLGISVGATAGVVIALATQNITGSVLAAVLLLGTRMVRVGEEITISGNKGIIADINLTHTVLSIDDDLVYVPNSLMISSALRRKKRNPDSDAGVKDW
jgi:small-conductance mechanosensitive channel